jgi:hypothetical protein
VICEAGVRHGGPSVEVEGWGRVPVPIRRKKIKHKGDVLFYHFSIKIYEKNIYNPKGNEIKYAQTS